MAKTVVIPKSKRVHFIGIGGAGMSAIARVFLEMGYKVSGSDLRESLTTIRLKDYGGQVYIRHEVKNMRLVDVVIISTAIPADNVELMFAKEQNLPIVKRAEALDFLMKQFDRKVAVTGTHGKTTTSSMVTMVLESMAKRPTFVIGGELQNFGGNSRYAGNDYFVAESDESDGSFLAIHPNLGVVTNIEEEHMDYYGNRDNLLGHFRQFMDGVIQRSGHLFLNGDDANICQVSESLAPEAITYFGIEKEAPISAKNLVFSENGTQFDLWIDGVDKGLISLSVHGRHNTYNALAAIALGLYEGGDLEQIKHGLSQFSGTKRRFQRIGVKKGIMVYDDYAHHPTEVRLTLEAAKKSLGQRIISIFQPHRYTRTADLLDDFIKAFEYADMVVITEIYSANEAALEGVTARLIEKGMINNGRENVFFVPKKSNIPSFIIPKLKENDVVITMGAGDIYTVAKEIVNRLDILAKQSESVEDQVDSVYH